MTEVVVVDRNNRPVSTCEKRRAHERPGVLHRAVSLLAADAEGRFVLQRRADEKYHFGGLWSNTCCTHPEPGEQPVDAVRRRAREELGIDCSSVRFVGSMIYRAIDPGSGLVEHEYDEIFVARTTSRPRPDPAEASDVAFVDPEVLARRLQADVAAHTPWHAPAFRLVCPALGVDPVDGRLTSLFYPDIEPAAPAPTGVGPTRESEARWT